MGYENSTACILLATNCCVCGRELVDSISVELGIGPECRKGWDAGINPETQKACNVLTHKAAVASQEGRVEEVRAIAKEIADLGLTVLAEKIVQRFKNAEKNAKIKIRANADGSLAVTTPYKRSLGAEFAAAWRAIPGRKWNGEANVIPAQSKRELWELLKRFFAGEFGKGPSGTFRIPEPTEYRKAI